MASLQCPIDMEALTGNDEIVSTPCGHVFHRHCVSDWLRISSKCPQCRKAVRPEHLRRLYINVSDEELKRLQREKADIQRELENLRSVGATSSHDSDAIYSQLKMTEIALSEERDRQENFSQELEVAWERLREIETEKLSIQQQLKTEKAKSSDLARRYDETTRKLRRKCRDLSSGQEKAAANIQQVRDAEVMMSKVCESLNEAQKKIASLENENQEAKSNIKGLNMELCRVKKNFASCQHQLQGATMMIQKMNENLKKEQLQSAEYSRQLESARQENVTLGSELQKLLSKNTTTKIGQEDAEERKITLRHLREIENERLSLQAQLRTESARLSALQPEYDKVSEMLAIKNKELVSAEIQAEDTKVMMRELYDCVSEAHQKLIKYEKERQQTRSTIKVLNIELEKMKIHQEEAEERNRSLCGELEAAKQLLADPESLSKRRDNPESSACVTEPHEACMDCIELRKRLKMAEHQLIDLKCELHDKETDISVLSTELEAARSKSEMQRLQAGHANGLAAENETYQRLPDLVDKRYNCMITHYDRPASGSETPSVDEAKTESSTAVPGVSGRPTPAPRGRRNDTGQSEAVSQDPSGSHTEAPRPTSEGEEAAEISDFCLSVQFLKERFERLMES